MRKIYMDKPNSDHTNHHKRMFPIWRVYPKQISAGIEEI